MSGPITRQDGTLDGRDRIERPRTNCASPRQLILALVLFGTACQGDGTQPEDEIAAAISSFSGSDQTGTVGEALAAPLAVRVVTGSGRPVAGVSVTWAVTQGGGSLSLASAVTDALGQAVVLWTLGHEAGMANQSATATVPGLSGSPVTFVANAIAGSPTRIDIASGNLQVTVVNGVLPLPIEVLLRDTFGNPVAGVAVAWAVTGGGGSLSNVSTTSDAQGKASVSWRLGTVAGSSNNSATASVASLFGSPVTFAASATAAGPASVAVAAGDGQSAEVGTAVFTDPSVVVRDQYGNAVQGHAVTFAVTRGGGVVSPTTAILTLANGTATVTSWTLGTAAGTNNNTVSATAAGIGSPVTFTASANAGAPMSVTISAGNGQSATVNTAVAIDPQVLVRDQFSNPVASHSVTFAVTGGGGLVSPTTAILTAADGTATATSWTLGTAAGMSNNTLRATAAGGGISGNPVTFTASATAGTAASITISAGNNQNAAVNTEVAVPPQVLVRDQFSNPVASHPVTFAVTGGGGSVSPTTAIVTGAGGRATVTSWTLGAAPGTNMLSATAAGTGLAGNPVVFTAMGGGPPVQFVSNDEGAFINATGATLEVSFPSPRALTTNPYTEGRVTLRDEGNSNNRVGDETPLLPGNEFVVSNVGLLTDNIVFTFGQRATAFGFWMVDGPGWDSRFTLEFFFGGSSIGSYAFDPPVNQPFFLGFSSQVGLDRVVLREDQPGADENDAVGKIFTRFAPP